MEGHVNEPASATPETAATESQEPERQRLRITYAKGEPIKFISHQDESLMWERTLRRADLPLLYKQGFNPQPHIQIAAPLGVGITGQNEFIDITLSPPLALEAIHTRIAEALPPGAAISAVEEVPLKAPSLQGLLIGADYTILIYAEPHELTSASIQHAIDKFLATAEIWRERERKGSKYTYNLRPLILELSYLGYDSLEETHRIHLRVQQRPGATGRPDEVVDELGLNRFARTLQRDRLYFAHQAEDLACFAAYPVISQSEITPAGSGESSSSTRKRKRRNRRTRPATNAEAPSTGETTERPTRARSINERAGDEFV
jgi:radical SAM-linked protein